MPVLPSKPKNLPRRVHIIGAGLSGLAAAITLSDAGVAVSLYEASPLAGGRCRAYFDDKLGRMVDNGNHLILRTNKRTLNYIKHCKSFDQFYAVAKYYHLKHPNQSRLHSFVPPKMPATISIAERLKLLKLWFSSSSATVGEFVSTHSNLSTWLVEPMCLAALNTHPSQASATMFRGILRRIMLPTSADYYQVRTDFNAALIQPALAFLTRQKTQISFNKRIASLETKNSQITSLKAGDEVIAVKPREMVIIATPPEVARMLLPQTKIAEFKHHAIINAHFEYDTRNLAPRLLGVAESPLHWVFLKDGLISTTTSHAESTILWGLDKAEIASQLWQQVCAAYGLPAETPLPENHRIITEKRATIAATPANLVLRPTARTSLLNARLAGDWLQSPYPACIEAAIISGEDAADWCLRAARKSIS